MNNNIKSIYLHKLKYNYAVWADIDRNNNAIVFSGYKVKMASTGVFRL